MEKYSSKAIILEIILRAFDFIISLFGLEEEQINEELQKEEEEINEINNQENK